jgi:RNA polymerase sigma factor (sigma-70 family)
VGGSWQGWRGTGATLLNKVRRFPFHGKKDASPCSTGIVIIGFWLYNGTKVEKRKSDLNTEEIVDKYRPIVSFRVKKSIGAHTPDWEDVVNEIMVNVLEKLKKGEFRGESSIGTFIYTITSRRIIDYIRQKSKLLKHAPESNPYLSPQDQIENKERAEWIAKAIEKLKPKYKEVLYLYYYQELSREEVAKRLNITSRRVSERVNYAQKLLRKVMKS